MQGPRSADSTVPTRSCSGSGSGLDRLNQGVQGLSDDDPLLVRGGAGELGGEGDGALLLGGLGAGGTEGSVLGGHLLSLVPHVGVHPLWASASAHLLWASASPVSLLPSSSLHHWDKVLGHARSAWPDASHYRAFGAEGHSGHDGP